MATIHTSIMIEDRMSKQFAAMNMAMLSVIDSFEQLESVSGNAIDVTSLRHAHSALQSVEAAFSQIEQEIRQAENAQESLNRDIRTSDELASNLLGTIGAIAGAYLSLQGIGEAIRISDEMTDTTARVQLLVDDMPVFDDQSVNVDVKASGISEVQHDIDNLNTLLTFNTNWNSLDIRQDLNALDDALVNVDVRTDGEQLAELSSTLAQVRTNEADVLLSVENTQSLDDVQGKVNALQATSMNVDVAVTGMSKIEQAQQLIFESAQRSYSSFKDTADMVSRIGSNAGDSFDSIAEVIAFTELIQKQFGIAGANAVEASNATIQLTQALASGVLRGDELSSIFEQAPNLIQSIEDYLDVSTAKIREMASEGQLTADIVKNAMFSAADDINTRFDSMPTTWSQRWTNMKNDALWAFREVLSYINDLANTDNMKSFLQDMRGQLYVLAEYAMRALQMMSRIGSFIYENWSLIEPIVGTAMSALMAYVIALGILKTAQIASAFWNGVMILATGLYTATSWASVQATLSATGAAWGLNAALAANPIFWVVMGVILFIGVLYLAVAVVNYFTGESYSATGLIAGFFAMLGAFIANVFFGLLEIVLGIIEALYNHWVAFANFFGNVFNDPIASIIHLFGDLGDNVLGVIEKIASAIDFVFGSNLASAVSGWRNELASLVKWAADEYGNGQYEVLYEELDVDKVLSDLGLNLERFEYGSAWDTGYDWGANLFNADQSTLEDSSLTDSFNDLTGLAGLDLDNLAAGLGGIEDAGKDTAANTGKLADSVTLLEEDLKYLRDAAERESINRYTTAEIKVDARSENYISSEADLDGIVDGLVERLEEAAEIAAEGGDFDV